jgi:hypothetical protein
MHHIVRRGGVSRLVATVTLATGVAGVTGAAYLVAQEHEAGTSPTLSQRKSDSAVVTPQPSLALLAAHATWMFHTTHYTPEPTPALVAVPGTWTFRTRDTAEPSPAPAVASATWMF